MDQQVFRLAILSHKPCSRECSNFSEPNMIFAHLWTSIQPHQLQEYASCAALVRVIKCTHKLFACKNQSISKCSTFKRRPSNHTQHSIMEYLLWEWPLPCANNVQAFPTTLVNHMRGAVCDQIGHLYQLQLSPSWEDFPGISCSGTQMRVSIGFED